MKRLAPIKLEAASSLIYKINRDGKTLLVMMDRDLAQFYQTEPKHINLAAKRNSSRFQDKTFKLI